MAHQSAKRGGADCYINRLWAPFSLLQWWRSSPRWLCKQEAEEERRKKLTTVRTSPGRGRSLTPSPEEIWGGSCCGWLNVIDASDAEERVCSSEDHNTLPLAEATQPSLDSDLIWVLTKAVEDLGLAWSAPKESDHSLLDKWYLKGCLLPTSSLPLSFGQFTRNSPGHGAALLRAC